MGRPLKILYYLRNIPKTTHKFVAKPIEHVCVSILCYYYFIISVRFFGYTLDFFLGFSKNIEKDNILYITDFQINI